MKTIYMKGFELPIVGFKGQRHQASNSYEIEFELPIVGFKDVWVMAWCQ